jgi:hypothetical protein
VKKAVLSVVLVTVGVGMSAALTPACYGNECRGDEVDFGSAAEGGAVGDLADPDTWESTPMDGTWFPYLHERTLHMHFPDVFGGRQPDWFIAYISADPSPNSTDGGHALANYTPASGNVAKFSGLFPDSITIFNDTCSDYFIRVVVHAPPLGANADAGADANAAADAAANANADAGAD